MSQDEPTEPEHPPSSAPPRPGERVGRFIVLDPLGSGGMGLVWSAFDPKLDRKVALKFLKAGGGEEREARLLREAQALARLSHPNVVAVHDVDTHGGRVFVAMELVVGRTLQDWLRQQRSWREVLRALLEAGRGVAAAHGAGIIHRDIKPANVLVGEDGRVRVSDFGLARALEESPTAPADAPVAEPALNEPMTGAGHVVGTREYMSPEQAAGAPLDARTDVYSFCVTAYEALCGIRPEALSMGFTVGLAPEPRPEPEPVRPTWRKSSDRQMLARLPAPAAGRKPPRRLLRHLAHGLQTDPDRRWPSMPPLLDALERDARPWRPWHLAAVAAVALAAASATVVRLGRDSCSVGAAQIAPVWSAADRDWLERSFSAAARGDPEAAPRAARLLDAYA
ncbi:MAG TPA: serine/threonine-protein kinase, partial [Myxococcales bacterium]|nr:serine/threonine-protein kinase [Myxococcales bacterium]